MGIDIDILKKEGLLYISQALIASGSVVIMADAAKGAALLILAAIVLFARGYMKKNGYSIDDSNS